MAARRDEPKVGGAKSARARAQIVTPEACLRHDAPGARLWRDAAHSGVLRSETSIPIAVSPSVRHHLSLRRRHVFAVPRMVVRVWPYRPRPPSFARRERMITQAGGSKASRLRRGRRLLAKNNHHGHSAFRMPLKTDLAMKRADRRGVDMIIRHGTSTPMRMPGSGAAPRSIAAIRRIRDRVPDCRSGPRPSAKRRRSRPEPGNRPMSHSVHHAVAPARSFLSASHRSIGVADDFP